MLCFRTKVNASPIESPEIPPTSMPFLSPKTKIKNIIKILLKLKEKNVISLNAEIAIEQIIEAATISSIVNASFVLKSRITVIPFTNIL